MHLRNSRAYGALALTALGLFATLCLFFWPLRRSPPRLDPALVLPRAPFGPNIQYLPSVPPLQAGPTCPTSDEETIHIATTALSGPRVDEVVRQTQNMIRSVDTFARTRCVRFHIITDEKTRARIQRDPWMCRLDLRFYETNLEPPWKTMFALGSCQRLFLHRLLPVPRVIYMDADTVAQRDVYEFWQYFDVWDPQQTIGAARESEIRDGYYLRWSDERVPFVPPVGVNAGVLLLRLDNLAKSEFDNEVQTAYERYGPLLFVGDQDVLNIVLHKRPEWLYLLPCEWNIREDSWCRMQRANQMGILHGNRGVFSADRLEHWMNPFEQTMEHHPFAGPHMWTFVYPLGPLRAS